LINYRAFPTDVFKKELDKLSDIEKRMVFKTVAVLEQNPFYPSLRTKKLKGKQDLFECSVNMDIRIIWRFKDRRLIIMLDVGHHDILKKY
jgi:mRNA-degrading endonuclease YafQ of YafQ-DinJ toxin-antitoxin module